MTGSDPPDVTREAFLSKMLRDGVLRLTVDMNSGGLRCAQRLCIIQAVQTSQSSKVHEGNFAMLVVAS